MIYTSPIDSHQTHISSFLSDSPTYNLIVLHGMSEHRHRYESFAETASNHHINVFTLDLRGHGDSPTEGTYGFVNGYMNQVHDLYHIIKMIRKEYPYRTYLMGHSMGSLFVRSYLKHYLKENVNGVIIMGSPYVPKGVNLLRLAMKPLAKLFPKKKSNLISNIMNRTFNKEIENPKTPLDWLSFNEDNVQNYINDPLCNFPLTYGGYADLFDLVNDVYQDDWKKIDVLTPVLFLIGSFDPCPDFKRGGFDNAIKKMKQDGYQNIQSIVYHQSRHELLFDNDSQQVTQDIIDFITK